MPGVGLPTIKWGTFYDREGNAHVAPVIDSYLMAGHKLKESCACSPTVDVGKKLTIMVHHVIH